MAELTNLQRRVLTASVLIPVVVGLVELGSSTWLAVVFAAIVLCASWEWAALGGWDGRLARGLYLGATAIVLGLVHWASDLPWLRAGIVTGGLLWWIAALYWLLAYERRGSSSPIAAPAASSRSPYRMALLGWVVLVPPWVALVEIHASSPVGPHLVVGLLVVIWAADIGAYFTGRRFGKRRMAPRVSPGKTWEGVAGGAALAAVAAAGLGTLVGHSALAFAVVGLLTAAFSVLGDLTESRFKREAGVKDSGGILPGHGGVLDRVDSLTAGAPVFLAGLTVVGFPG